MSVFAVPMAALALVSCGRNVGATSPSGAPTGQPSEPAATATYDPTATSSDKTSTGTQPVPGAETTGPNVKCSDTPLPALPASQFNRTGIQDNLWKDFNHFNPAGDAIANDGHTICVGS